MKSLFNLLLFFTLTSIAQGTPETYPLWQNGAPGFEHKQQEPESAADYWVKNIHNPSITVYRPENPNGSAVLIFPGGGHHLLVIDEEGTKAAKHLNTLGVTGIVVKYRLFRGENSSYTPAHFQEDAARAMQLVRHKASALNIDKNRVGVMGFSAGGEVVNSIVFGESLPTENSNDTVSKETVLPNFHIQIYPGPMGIPKVVSQNAPPLFVLASNNDACCSVSILDLLIAYRKANRSVQAHFYEQDDHGFNMGNRSSSVAIQHWPERLSEWLIDNDFFDE